MLYDTSVFRKIVYASVRNYLKTIKQEKKVYYSGFHDANGDWVRAQDLPNYRINYNRLVRLEKKYEQILQNNFIRIIFPESTEELYNIHITRLIIGSLIIYEGICQPIFKCYNDYKSITEKNWRELPQDIQSIYYDSIDEIKQYQEVFETDRVSELEEIFNLLKSCRYAIK